MIRFRTRRVGVIGGGLAGLVVAFRCAARGDDVLLLEASPKIGGQIDTTRARGFVVEHGAEGFAVGSNAVYRLCVELGIERELVEQRVRRSYGFDGSSLSVLDQGEAPARLGLRAAHATATRGVVSFRRGMKQIVEALQSAVDGKVESRVGTPVRRIARSSSAWRLTTAHGAEEVVDTLAIATSASVAGTLLAPSFEAARPLVLARAHPSVSVSLAYPRSTIAHPLDATGFVITSSDGGECRACAFSSSKFPDRAPPDHALLRVFFRPSDEDQFSRHDAEWVEESERILARALGTAGAPARAWVSRFREGLPVADAEHHTRVAKLESALIGQQVVLAGAAFHGHGIEGAVRSAEIAALELEPPLGALLA